MRFLLIGLFSVILITPSLSYANDTFNWGVYIKAGNYGVEDPDGEADEEFTYSPGLKFTFPVSRRGKQLVVSGEYIDFDLDASTEYVGQEVNGYRLSGGYEHQFNLARSLKVWGGITLNIDTFTFDGRHTIDQDGYLAQRYEDLEETSLGVSGYLFTVFDMNSSWAPGIGLFVDYPMGDGVYAIGGFAQLIFE